jgi:hypothetical protein
MIGNKMVDCDGSNVPSIVHSFDPRLGSASKVAFVSLIIIRLQWTHFGQVDNNKQNRNWGRFKLIKLV